MAQNDAPTFVMRERDVPDPVEVVLRDLDLPFGFRREVAMWETGGSVEIADGEGTYLPGRGAPIINVMYTRERPRTIRGALRAGYAAQMGYSDASTNGGATEAQRHPRELRDRIDLLRKRANIIEVTWAGETFAGILKDTKFGEEHFNPAVGADEITYELMFLVGEPHETTSAAPYDYDPARKGVNESLFDVTAVLLSRAAARRTEMDALALQATFFLAATTAWDNFESTLNDVSAAVQNLEQRLIGKGFSILVDVQRAASAAKAAQDAQRELVDTISVQWTEAMDDATTTARYSWEVVSFGTVSEAEDWATYLRVLRAGILARIRQNTLVYEVVEGDTLDSIARKILRDGSRAAELGITPADVVPGNQVLLPAV